MEHLDDLEFARRLHEQLNGSLVTVPALDLNKIIETKSEVIEISDEECETIQNQQAITIRRNKLSTEDFFMPKMNSFVNLAFQSDWAIVNLDSNIQQIFDRLKDQYFKLQLTNSKYVVQWDTSGILSDSSSFKIIESHNSVVFGSDAMTRPRIQIISMVLHVLIHICLNVMSKGSIKINSHEENFREIMLLFNDTLQTQITTSHKLPYASEDAEHEDCWYRCTGICSAYEPFHGTIYCKTTPSEAHAFWKRHEDACGGQYFKVFSMQRYNEESASIEKKFVRNVHYMLPKSRDEAAKVKANTKTNIRPRELWDLTDDAESSAKVQNLCDVIDLDTTDFNQDEVAAFAGFCLNVKSQIRANSLNCPFCLSELRASLFQSHVDSCCGYQQKVEFSLKNLKHLKKPK